jgi:ferritin-like metal-binding protein YciE
MPTMVSNPRDLVLVLLADVYYVERRLAGGVMRDLAGHVRDVEPKTLLEVHRAETRLDEERAAKQLVKTLERLARAA